MLRVKAQEALPQAIDHGRERHRRARMAGVGLLDRVHREGTDRIDRQLYNLLVCHGCLLAHRLTCFLLSGGFLHITKSFLSVVSVRQTGRDHGFFLRASWPFLAKLMDSPRMRVVSWGAWNPVEFSASTKSRRNCAFRWKSRAEVNSSSVLPAARASLRSCIRSIKASIATLRRLKNFVWIVSTRARSSSSGQWWQVWQARLMFSSGLRT